MPSPLPPGARPARSLATAAPLPVVLAHATGFSWDEALMVLAPIAIVAGVLLYVNQKLRRGLDQPDDGAGDPTTDPGDGAGDQLGAGPAPGAER